MRNLILAAVLLAGLLPGRAAANVVTASFLDDAMDSYVAGGPCSGVAVKCQTFTAEQSGRLYSVGLRLYVDAGFPGLQVAVYALDANGLPTGDPLAGEAFATDAAPTTWPAALETFVYTGSTPVLQAGTAYAIVVQSADTASDLTFTWNGYGYAQATYAGGRFMQRTCDLSGWSIISYDMGFAVTVDESVPNATSSWSGVKALFR